MVAFFWVGAPQKGMKIIKFGRHLVEGISYNCHWLYFYYRCTCLILIQSSTTSHSFSYQLL